MSFGTTPLSTTPLGANQFPTSSVSIPNHAGGNLTAMRGGRASTDSNSNETAAGEVFIADLLGAGVSLTTATTFSGVPSVSQLAAGSYALLANPGGMATFLAELQTSAFVGTLSFYGLEPDGAKLQLISAHQRGATTIATSVALSIVSATNQVWAGNIAAFSAVYVVCTAWTSGAITVTPTMSAGVYAVSITNTVLTQDANSAAMKTDLDTIVTQTSGLATAANQGTANTSLATIATNTTGGATQATLSAAKTDLDSIVTNTTGLATDAHASSIVTNTAQIPAKGAAAIVASTPVNIASDQIVPIKGSFTEQASLSAGSLNADLLASTDVSAYKYFSLALSGTWVGTLSFQGSNDNSTFFNINVLATASTGGPVSTATANNLFFGPVIFRYLRVRMTAYTSGTATGVIELYTFAPTLYNTTANVNQGGTWTVQPGNTANTTPWLQNVSQIGGQAPTLDNTTILAVSARGKNSTAGDTPLLVDSSGRQISVDQLRNALLNGQAWSCSTDFISASANMAGEFFVPNTSAKSVLIWSVRLSYTNANQYAWTRYITAVDSNIDSGTSVIGNVVNLKGGAASPVSGATFKYNSSVTQPAVSASTLPIAADPTALNAVYEALATGEARLVPAGTAGGIACYHNTTAAGKWSMSVRFIEF